MKIFKKFLAALVAVVMAFGIFAFAACDTDSKNDGTTNGGDSGDTGNGGGTGTTKTPAELLLDAVDKASSYVELSAEYTSKMHRERYEVSSLTDEKPETVNKYDNTVNVTLAGKADIEKGNGDLSYSYSDTNEEDDGISYFFLRDWNMFTCHTGVNEETGKVEEITDFSKETLFYLGDLNVMLGDYIAEISGSMGGGSISPDMPATLSEQPSLDVGTMASPAVHEVNTVLVKLAIAADTLEVKDGVYTVDVIKTFNKVWTEISAVVKALDENTTVGDVLANATVKKYLSIFTELVPAQTIYDAVVEVLKTQSSEMQIALAFLKNIKPDEGSTTYDYLVKLISSDDFKLFVNTMLKAKKLPELTTTIDKAKVNDLLALAEMDIASVKAMLETLPFEISNEKLVITDKDEDDIYITNYTELKLGYTLADGKLTKQSLSVKYNDEGKSSYGMGSTDSFTYYVTESSNATELSATLKYVESAATLADISKCNVIKEEVGFIDGESGFQSQIHTSHFNDNEHQYYGEYIDVDVKAQVDENGKVVGVYVNGDKENPVADGKTYDITATVRVYNDEGQPVESEETFTVLFTLEQGGYYVYIEIKTEEGRTLAGRSIYDDDYSKYYTSTVSKILAGKPDWTLVAE